MVAAVADGYGGPEVVRLGEVPVPTAGRGEVVVAVAWSTVGRTETCIRAAMPSVAIRAVYGLRRPRVGVLGAAIAGTVVEVGREVDTFAIGDMVMGFDDQRLGGHAPFAARPASSSLVPLPDGVEPAAAAAVLEGAHYALPLVDRLAPTRGDRVLLQGGGGAIGVAALQLLVAAGCETTALVDAGQQALVQDLGAAGALDRATTTITDLAVAGERFDHVVDTVEALSFRDAAPALVPGGGFVSVSPGRFGHHLVLAAASSLPLPGRAGRPRVVSPLPRSPRTTVPVIADRLRRGELTPVVETTMPLTDIVAAHRLVDGAAKTGSVVIEVDAPESEQAWTP